MHLHFLSLGEKIIRKKIGFKLDLQCYNNYEQCPACINFKLVIFSSVGSMGFMMNVSDGSVSSYGRHSPTASIACH